MKPGFYPRVDAVEYHNDPCETPSLNYSTAKRLLVESDWHAWRQHPRLGGERFNPSKQMDIGSIVHALLLVQPLDGMVEILEAQDYKKKSTQEARDNAKECGKLVILARQYNDLLVGLPQMRANLAEAGILLDGHRESTVVWETDCLCRTRIDEISEDLCSVVDLKCTANANPLFLERHIIDMCYEVQAAAEIEAIETVHPELVGRVKFTDVFLEIEPPYFVVAAELSESMLEHGRSRWGRAKSRWNKCLETNVWRGFVNKMIAHAPNYAINREFGEVVAA